MNELRHRLGAGLLRPMVLECAEARAWLRSGRWTPSVLAAEGPPSLTVKRSADRHFMYVDANAREELLPDDDLATGARTEVVTMPTAEFFDACSRQQWPRRLLSSASGER